MKSILSLLLLSNIVFAANTGSFEFLVKSESKVKNVFYDRNFKKLVVLVDDDGTKRNGYAEYIALTLHNRGFTTNDVAVIYVKDAKTPNRNGDRLLYAIIPYM